MAKKNSVYKKKEDGSFEFWGYLPKEDVVSALTYTTDIGNINTRLTTAETAIADRYTKAEVDSKVDDKMSYMQTVAKWEFNGNGRYKYCKIATIKLASIYANKPIIFECTGRGCTYVQIISIYPIVWDSVTSNYQFVIYRTTDDMGWGIKDEGNGLCSLYCELTEVWGNVVVNRVYGDGIRSHTVSMIMASATGFPGGTVFASPIIHALKADESTNATNADVATTYTYANSKGTITSTSFNSSNPFTNTVFEENYANHPHLVIARSADPYSSFFANSWSSGLFWNEGDTWAGFSVSNQDYDKRIRFVVGGIGGNGGNPAWKLDLVTNDNIADQTVKSFTATEIGHGDKFDGDLSSTTLASSPLHMAVSEFSTSEANSPTAPRTLTGNIEVTFGSTKKTIADMKYNPFMAYFFKHGYHFSAVKEGGDSTLYDKGVVTYGQFIYYCVYSYRSDGTDSFDAAIIMTDDTTEMSKYVMYESGKAKDLMIEGNYIRTEGGRKVAIQENEGTLALMADIPSVPSVVDNLDSSSSSSTLSAYQGKVLNDKISAIKINQLATNSSIGSIGASNSKSDEDLSYSARLYGGVYGRFYVFSCLENGYNSDYGKLAVKTSSTGKADMTTNMVAGVSGETGWWAPQWLSLSVFVPANKYYYLWGCRVTHVYYSCIELAK